MSVGAVCTRTVITVAPNESVRVAAKRIADNEVGTLVILDAHGRPIGIITDRDIAVRCVARDLDPDTTQVAAVMTSPVMAVTESTPIEDALTRMARVKARRLVVTGRREKLVGILALDDVLELLVEEVGTIGHILRSYGTTVPA